MSAVAVGASAPVATTTRRPLLTADAETFAISPDGTRAVLSVADESSALMIAEGVNLD